MAQKKNTTGTSASKTKATNKTIQTSYSHIFKLLSNANYLLELKLRNFTEEEITRYIANPIQYSSQLIDINHFLYNTFGFFRELISYYVEPVLYRWTVNTLATDLSFEKAKPDRIKKDFILYSNRINQLNIGRELHRILTKMFLEDAVFGYWVEEGDSASIYYLPSSWCEIKSTVNGNWCYKINSKRPSSKELEKLPKELQSLVKEYSKYSGDDAWAPVPFEKSVCFKYNDHFNYIFPPFTYVITLVLNLIRSKQISLAKDEQEVINLIQMLIPIDDERDDHLRLTDDVIAQFAEGAQDLIPENNAIIPTPMEMSVLETNKSRLSERNVVENAINAFTEETGMPSFGSANNAAEMKRAIENAAAKVFTILDQISNVITLKMKYDGFTFNNYEFEYEILHMNVFNEIETQEALLKQAQVGAVSKFRIEAARGNNPSSVIGQYQIENVIFREMFDNLTVPPSSFTQTTSSETIGGRTEVAEDKLTPAGTQTRENDSNNPANRDI